MGAALTIIVLLALSITIVRFSSVAMRLTGLPDNVARFQCISALTGTGFTTHESEMIVNYPIRRRILVALMLFGNLGLISVAATFIVAFTGADYETNAILVQALTLVGAIGLTFLILTNKTLDRLMCSTINRVLLKTTSLGHRRYQHILQLDNGFSVAEHRYGDSAGRQLKDLALDNLCLTLLAIRGDDINENMPISADITLSARDVLVCYGSDTAHDRFDLLLKGQPGTRP